MPDTTSDTQIVPRIHAVSAYVKLHEILIITVLSLLLVWGVSGKIEGVFLAHDTATLNAEKASLAAQVEKNEAIAKTVSEQSAAYATLLAQANEQQAAIARMNAQLTAALAKQQQTNNNMTLPELAGRWMTLVPKASGGLSINNGQMLIADSAAHATVNELEQVPVLQQQLSNATVEKETVDKLLVASNGRVDTLNSRVEGLTLQIGDSDKVCKAQIAVVKAQARKQKRWIFVVGYISGFLSRQLIKP